MRERKENDKMVLDMLSEMRKVVVNNLQFGISSKKMEWKGGQNEARIPFKREIDEEDNRRKERTKRRVESVVQ